jgi:hypothetical protein
MFSTCLKSCWKEDNFHGLYSWNSCSSLHTLDLIFNLGFAANSLFLWLCGSYIYNFVHCCDFTKLGFTPTAVKVSSSNECCLRLSLCVRLNLWCYSYIKFLAWALDVHSFMITVNIIIFDPQHGIFIRHGIIVTWYPNYKKFHKLWTIRFLYLLLTAVSSTGIHSQLYLICFITTKSIGHTFSKYLDVCVLSHYEIRLMEYENSHHHLQEENLSVKSQHINYVFHRSKECK